jgi:hypothetical protein
MDELFKTISDIATDVAKVNARIQDMPFVYPTYWAFQITKLLRAHLSTKVEITDVYSCLNGTQFKLRVLDNPEDKADNGKVYVVTIAPPKA